MSSDDTRVGTAFKERREQIAVLLTVRAPSCRKLLKYPVIGKPTQM